MVASDESDADSDGAPEDVGFADSKASVLQTVRDAVTQIEKDKQKTKHKRRQLDEKYKEQKVGYSSIV